MPDLMIGIGPSKRQESSAPAEDEASDVEVCMEEFIKAVHAKDAKGAAEAFEAAFSVLEAAPHEEAEHEE